MDQPKIETLKTRLEREIEKAGGAVEWLRTEAEATRARLIANGFVQVGDDAWRSPYDGRVDTFAMSDDADREWRSFLRCASEAK